MKRTLAALGQAVASCVPAGLRARLTPAARYFNMLFADHVWVRLGYTNRRKLAEGAWRSAQPLPHQLRRYKNDGLRSIVNLRGRTRTSTYVLEKEACAQAGLTLVDLAMKSRAAPSREMILALRDLIQSVEHPVLFHCKSGADRAGLVGALYLHLRKGVPMTEARRQLALRYGHIRQADTGILDAFLERYIADNAVRPMAFMTWVETVYDAEDLQRTYTANRWFNRVLKVLRRE